MRYRLNPSYATIAAVILVFASCVAPAIAKEPSESDELNRIGKVVKTSVRTVRIPFAELKRDIVWQKSPVGEGEFVPFPYKPLSAVRADKRIFVGTALGLLRSADAGRWEIVSSLYGRPMNPIAEKNGLLWVQEHKSPYCGSGIGMIALEPKSLLVEKEVANIGGDCIAVEDNSFWCILGDWEPEVIEEYDLHGNLKRRHDAIPRIIWSSVDPEAVWFVILWQSSGRDDPPEYHLFRLDRSTWKEKEIQEAGKPYLKAPFGSTRERIFWTCLGDRVYQLDKTTLKLSELAKLNVGLDCTVSMDEKKLWLFHQPRNSAGHLILDRYPWTYHFSSDVISLDSFKPIDPDGAGYPPITALSPFWMPDSYRTSLSATLVQFWACSSESLWFVDGNQRLIELRDDGRSFVRDLSPFIKTCNRCWIAAVPSAVYVAGGDALLRIEPGSEEATLMDIDNPGDSIIYLGATDTRVWLRMGHSINRNRQKRRLLSISLDPSEMREVEFPEKTHLHDFNSFLIEDLLYAWRKNPGTLFRINGATGKVVPIQSRHIKEYGDCISGSVILPDGRISLRLPYDDSVIYDPDNNLWQKPDIQMHFWPVRVGSKLYGLCERQVGECVETKWEAFGKLPFGPWISWSSMWDDETPKGTNRYLYIKTSIGLYRWEWSPEE